MGISNKLYFTHTQTHHSHSSALSEEKRRLDAKLATLEEDFEEEQMASESAQEKASKLQQQADQLSGEVSQLQAAVSRADSAKSQLEKQVKDLREKVEEAESFGARKMKAQLSAMDSRVKSLEEQLDVATRCGLHY